MAHLDVLQDTRLYNFSKLLDCITDRSQVFSVLVTLSFSSYNFAMMFDITVIRNNITRIIWCGSDVNQRRLQGETMILSLHLSLITLTYTIQQLLKCQKSVTSFL
jgi:hypothetical protein